MFKIFVYPLSHNQWRVAVHRDQQEVFHVDTLSESFAQELASQKAKVLNATVTTVKDETAIYA